MKLFPMHCTVHKLYLQYFAQSLLSLKQEKIKSSTSPLCRNVLLAQNFSPFLDVGMSLLKVFLCSTEFPLSLCLKFRPSSFVKSTALKDFPLVSWMVTNRSTKLLRKTYLETYNSLSKKRSVINLNLGIVSGAKEQF